MVFATTTKRKMACAQAASQSVVFMQTKPTILFVLSAFSHSFTFYGNKMAILEQKNRKY